MKRVVCIHNKPKFKDHPGNRALSRLKVGEIYTVARTIDEGDGDTAYILKEVVSDSWCGGWNSEKFRPVDPTFGEEVCKRIAEEAVTVLT